MKKTIAVLSLAMLLAACGGGPDPGGGGGENPEPSSPSSTGAGGWVTVDGTTYEFSFGDPPRCNIPDDEGRLNASGSGVTDGNNLQVTFSYATAEMSTTGDPSMQIVINVDGEQLWYSAVGFFDTDRGSIGDITVDGDTVMISGSLEDATDDSIVAAFTAEATCDA